MPTREELKASAKLRHFESQYDVLTTPIRPACGHLTFVVDRGMDQCLECSMRANKELKLETARAIDYSGQDG